MSNEQRAIRGNSLIESRKRKGIRARCR